MVIGRRSASCLVAAARRGGIVCIAALLPCACAWVAGLDDEYQLDPAGAAGSAVTGTGAAGAPGGAGAAGATGVGGAAGGGGGAARCPTGMVWVGLGALPYCIDATEVTNSEYAAFFAELDGGLPDGSAGPECGNSASAGTSVAEGDAGAALPVSQVSWCDAFAYCTSAGKRLCGKVGDGALLPYHQSGDTKRTSEWYVACSLDEAPDVEFSTADGACDSVSCPCVGAVDPPPPSKADAGGPTACAPARPLSGVLHLSGNVSEWENACDQGNGCRIRGGSYAAGSTSELKCAAEKGLTPASGANDVGFRCCANAR